MKRLLAILLLFFPVVLTNAQTSPPAYLWPVAGAKAGTGIISAPQSYIAGELNFANLFIGAPEGAAVVSPVDGVITSVSISYLASLVYSSSFGYGADKSFDEGLRELRESGQLPKIIDQKYLNGTIGIRSNDGAMIWIGGLTGAETFKTGQKVSRGEAIGKAAYSYRKIQEPAISIAISKAGKAADPMSPFGIRSSFIPPQEIKPVVSLTREQAKEDFTVYIDALKEAFPGLYDVVTKEELEQYVARTIASIDAAGGDLPFADFWDIIRGAVARIHDSHIYLHPPQWSSPAQRPSASPALGIGWLQGSLVCRNALKEHSGLINKQIVSINGMGADSIKRLIASRSVSYDAGVESVKEYDLAYPGFREIFKGNFDMDVEFADGQRIALKQVQNTSGMVFDMRNFVMINRYPEGYKTRILNDSTAYLGLYSFQLNQVQVEQIGSFIDSISSHKPYLIVDVRNNGGGHVEVLEKLYSYIAGEPFTVNSYSKVNKCGGFRCFNYSLNRAEEDEPFADYLPEEGKEGFYERPAAGLAIKADSMINYKGKVYVLTNENSTSAATLFPAMLVRNHRGVTVGRETCTAYHFMNALKFADIRLPNSTVVITIPLVHCVFDTEVNERAPYGRGVLPDYHVPITLDELTYKNGDAILNYTLQLIGEGKYLAAENPFATPAPNPERKNRLAWIVIILAAATAALLIKRNRTKR